MSKSGAERIAAAFARGKKAFVAYVSCGDPSVDATAEIVCAAAKAGADVIELGVPFSEPSADGVAIQRAMERLMVGRTTIVIAHRLSTVRALDRLLVSDKGRIVEEGTHETLVNRDGGIYRRLFERQALELTKGLRVA